MSYDLFACMDFYWWKGLGWLSYIIGLMWFIYMVIQNYMGSFGNIIWFGLVNSKLISKSLTKDVYKISIILLVVMMFSNLWGLNGGSFSMTAQILYVIHMSMMIWLGLQISSLNWNFMQYMGNMVIKSTPLVLGIVLSVVELLGNMVRPFSLCLRLSMNMTTGHMLLGLLAGGVVEGNLLSGVLVFVLGFYMLFECLICMIQGFVFTLLMGEYYSEHTN